MIPSIELARAGGTTGGARGARAEPAPVNVHLRLGPVAVGLRAQPRDALAVIGRGQTLAAADDGPVALDQNVMLERRKLLVDAPFLDPIAADAAIQ